MRIISEQVKELRELADGYKMADRPLAANTIYQAADTIEVLSAKLQAANMERSERHVSTDEQWADCSGWIDGKKVIEQIENEIDGVIVKDTYSKGKNAGLRKAKIFIEEQMNHSYYNVARRECLDGRSEPVH